jgi:hypothetical protein
MSKIALTPNASGTGTLTIAAPNTSTDRTLTLPDSTGTIDTLGRAGNVLQVVSATYSTQASNGSATFANTNLSASITPSSTSSNILVIVNQSMQAAANTTDSRDYGWRLLRNGSVILTQTQRSDEEYNTGYDSKALGIGHCNYLDSPNTTSSVTYSTQINVSNTSADVYAQFNGCTSVITLMEIAG